jgi:hypothetical protein
MKFNTLGAWQFGSRKSIGAGKCRLSADPSGPDYLSLADYSTSGEISITAV